MNSRGFRQRFVFSTLRCSSWLILGLASFGSVLAQEGYSLHRALYDSQVTEVNSYHTPECEEFFAAGYGARDPKLEKKCLLLPRALPATGADAADSTKTVEVEIAGTIQRLTDQVTTFVGTIAVLMIVVYGFRISVSFNDSEALEKSKKGIVWCLTGLVVITFAYVIVKTVVSIAFLGQDTEIWIDMKWATVTEQESASSDGEGLLAVVTINQDANNGELSSETEFLTFNVTLANNSPMNCSASDSDTYCIADGSSRLLSSNLGRLIMANSVGNTEGYKRTKSIKICENADKNRILNSEVKIECSQELNGSTAEGALYFRVNKHSFCSQLPAARSAGDWKFEEDSEDKKTIDAVFGKLKEEYKKIEKNYTEANIDSPEAKSIAERAGGTDLLNKFIAEAGSSQLSTEDRIKIIQAVLKYHYYYNRYSFVEYIKQFSPGLEVNDNCKQVDGKYGPCTKAALAAWCVDPDPFPDFSSMSPNGMGPSL